MPQETLVVKLSHAEQALLRERMEAGDFDYRPAPHAHFSARGEGVVATLYRSGKLVVQGAEPRIFAERYLDRSIEEARPADLPAPDRPLVGSDEVGKGDYFGPLVAVAVRVEPAQRAELVRSGVADSKSLSDERMRRLGPALRERYTHAVELLRPLEYNREHARTKNLNPMLADLHARAIRAVASAGDVVLVDRFAAESLVADRLSGLEVDLHQTPRAEREPVVAAASVIARAVFLEELHALSEEHAVDLHKGAGAPTDDAARRFVKIHGFDALERVAKLHFKNTKKLRG